MTAPIAVDPHGFDLPLDQRRWLRWTIYIGYAALVAGVFHGLAQALSYARIDILRFFPGLKGYYQGLTAHGAANVLTFTFAFANGFLPLTTARGLGRPLNRGLLIATFATLLLGNLLTIYAVVGNRASVLFTTYAPLQAHWTYYTGIALIVVSTWLAGINMFQLLWSWRRDNPGSRIPLLSFISVTTYGMWMLASIPVAVLYLFFLLPWSLGIVERTDPLFDRTLFWFTGHAIVYAWLLPAYVSWYAFIPRQVGGKLISDAYVRITFLLFLLLSIPTGFHHQYVDPGIHSGMKAVHLVLTFGVFLPSLITAFTVTAALEMGARSRGGRGIIRWFAKLPWGDPSVAAQLLAMITFVFGGITGLVNASFSMNQVIHNTTWVPGHFHLTVGSAVALTYMGIAYWLIPYLTRRALWSRGVALASSWVYTIGVLIFARGMISGGLQGMPRRTFMAQASYYSSAWDLAGMLTAIGGTLMFFGIMLFFVDIGMTIFAGREGEEPRDLPLSETMTAPSLTGWDRHLDRFGLWVAAAIVLILIAYAPFFLSYGAPRAISPGFRLY